MSPFPDPEKQEKESPDFIHPIKRLYVQIRKMPELTTQARMVDEILIHRLQDLKGTASAVIDQFHEQKKMILQLFDHWIMPIAQDVLDGFIRDAQHLKSQLDHKLENPNKITPNEWDEEAKHWALLYNKWNDRKGLVNKILEVVADRTQHLIEKDVQVIKDYQTQSLSHLPPESGDFKNLEKRLTHAIEEPLKQLMNLSHQAKEQSSLQQASEWIAKLQERRESYFDQLLMKIDYVVKDVVNLDDTKDWTAFIEIEGEVLFMERELHHINQDLTHIHLIEEEDRQFLLGRLEGLLDHIEDLKKLYCPHHLQARIQTIKLDILFSISLLQ